jgi:hypothetical protein
MLELSTAGSFAASFLDCRSRHRPIFVYGNATVSGADVDRLTRVTQSILNLAGTVQTQPSVGPDGQPDGQARNADNLQLLAFVNTVGGVAKLLGSRFSTAVEPMAVKFYNPQKVDAVNEPNSKNWHWGVEWTMEAVPDGNGTKLADLKGVEIREKMKTAEKSGYFASPAFGGFVDQTDPIQADVAQQDPNTVSEVGENVAAARKKLRGDILAVAGPHKLSRTQIIQFKDSRMDAKDKTKWYNVKKSGYLIQFTFEVAANKKITLSVSREPKDVNDVKPGEMKDADKKAIPVDI